MVGYVEHLAHSLSGRGGRTGRLDERASVALSGTWHAGTPPSYSSIPVVPKGDGGNECVFWQMVIASGTSRVEDGRNIVFAYVQAMHLLDWSHIESEARWSE